MKKLAFLAAAITAALAPQMVSADAYLGGKLGKTWLDDSCSQSSPCDDDSFGGGIFAGYNFTDMFGIEAGYDRLGSFESNFDNSSTNVPVDDKLNALTIAPKLQLPVTEKLDAYAKLGAAWVDYDDYDDTTLFGALGAEYALSDTWDARLEYQRINGIDDKYIDSMDADTIFLGLAYKFGAAKPTPAPAPVPAPVVKPEPKPEPAPVVKPEPQPEPKPEPEPVKQTKIFKEFGVELFDTNSANLAQGSAQYFDWLVDVMKKHPQAKAEIIGHTDSLGSAAYNQTLSERRAQAVADYLIQQGIEPVRLTVRGAGESSPKASNDTAEGRMQNRRVEVVIDEFEYQE